MHARTRFMHGTGSGPEPPGMRVTVGIACPKLRAGARQAHGEHESPLSRRYAHMHVAAA